jgi:hypothetical protein
MKKLLAVISIIFIFTACSRKDSPGRRDLVVANGQMPNLAKDKDNNLHLVYGNGDSIMYLFSSDNGNSFSKPSLIAVVPHVYTTATRGPQIAATKNGLVVTACTSLGNIYSFYKDDGSSWVQGKKVNDVDTIAKEGLMALSADGESTFAVWLDLRGNNRNKIYGARSTDGGKTWSANVMVYASPDTSVCECCKPSVAIKGSNVYVMFRNWLDGNRDLYLAHSSDGGNTFQQAKKLGEGSWALNGCPMDGGGLVIDKNGTPETVWRRHNKIYLCRPGNSEIEIGDGRSCTIESVNGKNVYAWTENGHVIISKPRGLKKNLGKGALPVIKSINNEHIICVWENENKIHASILEL